MKMIDAKSIFSTATGFIARGGFDWTCNPFVGCTFGCTYCYAAFLPQNRQPIEDWGKWLHAKKNAVEVAQKQAKKVAGKCVYMSSVTDPYLPVERSLQLTRGILEALVPHQPRLCIQTRGPLVIRDIDVLQKFDSVRVNVSIPTDSEDVRELFEPKAPRLEDRWKAVVELRASGVPFGLCITPTLPIVDVPEFVERIAEAGAAVVVTQDFHIASGFGADTGGLALALREELGWTSAKYVEFVQQLTARLPKLYEGEKGFFPPPKKV